MRVPFRLVDVFTSLGFRIAEGPEVEDDWHNFQALNIPPDHPARTMKDSLYVQVPEHPELLLRTETSAVQVRTMLSQPPPVFVVAPGRVYRRETADPTHLPVFGSRGRVHHGFGFTGNGVGPSYLGGEILARLALDRRDERTRLALVEPPRKLFPPEPLRYAGGALIRRALVAKDAAEDEGREPSLPARIGASLPRRLGLHLPR